METKQLNYRETERKRAVALFKGQCGGLISGIERDFALKDRRQNLWDKINHLFPMRHDKENVLKIAQVICDDFIDVLQINTDNCSPAYIQFEAVSDMDHLNEGIPTRGANCTSVNAPDALGRTNGTAQKQ